MNYSGIITDDIANGLKIRTSLFVSGCRNNCPGCFNKEEQNFDYGDPFTKEVENYILDSIDDEYHNGITILGGDPMEPENADTLIKFVKKFRERFGDSKSIWIYSGYTFEFLINTNDNRAKLLQEADVLVDGPFIEKYKDSRLKFKGSSNQRIIDIKATMKNHLHNPVIIG